MTSSSNTLSGSRVQPVETVTAVSNEQRRNAPMWMCVTVDGMAIDLSDVQPANASSPICALANKGNYFCRL